MTGEPDDDPTAAQIRAQARYYRASNTNRRPGPDPLFWKGVACGLPLTAAIWLVLWLVFRSP